MHACCNLPILLPFRNHLPPSTPHPHPTPLPPAPTPNPHLHSTLSRTARAAKKEALIPSSHLPHLGPECTRGAQSWRAVHSAGSHRTYNFPSPVAYSLCFVDRLLGSDSSSNDIRFPLLHHAPAAANVYFRFCARERELYYARTKVSARMPVGQLAL